MADLQESSSFLEYVALFNQLRGLISDGKGESDEADHLRDRMDRPWGQLTAEEIERIDKLAADPEVPLTKDEIEVLRQVAHGLSNKEIARALHLHVETVKEQVQHILAKIAVSDRNQAATWAARKQLI